MPFSTSRQLVCFAKVKVRLRESAVSPDPSLLAHAIELAYKIWPMPFPTSHQLVCFAKVQVRLRESAVSPDPLLLAHAMELAYKIWLSLYLHPIF